jgi:integrase/recombinase XerD
MADVQKKYQISIYLDSRRAKKSGRYPVKLRVFTSHPRMQKLYPTKFEFTKEEFHSIWETKKPRGTNKDFRLLLQEIENKANKAADAILDFNIEEFEKNLLPENSTKFVTVNDYYKKTIELYRHNNKYTTATSYEYSLKSLMNYCRKSTLSFKTITSQWLKDYQAYMEKEGRSKTTIGIYLRPLRAIFNSAIADNIIKQELYPFGKKGYSIPNPKTIKTSISKEELGILFNGKPIDEHQKKAKAFWFFSYACNGMNMKDIAILKYKDIGKDDTIVFYRNKSKDTNAEQKPIIIYLNDFTKGVVAEYGNQKDSEETLIFPIIRKTDNTEERDRLVSNFNRFVNQHINRYSNHLGLDIKINPKIARHSFATNAIRSGAGMEFVQESLGHSNIKTTQNYFAGFADEQKRDIANKMMDF